MEARTWAERRLQATTCMGRTGPQPAAAWAAFRVRVILCPLFRIISIELSSPTLLCQEITCLLGRAVLTSRLCLTLRWQCPARSACLMTSSSTTIPTWFVPLHQVSSCTPCSLCSVIPFLFVTVAGGIWGPRRALLQLGWRRRCVFLFSHSLTHSLTCSLHTF